MLRDGSSICSIIRIADVSNTLAKLLVEAGEGAPEHMWTVLSVHHLHATYDGRLSVLQLDSEGPLLYRYFTEHDFAEAAHLADGRHIWLQSADVSAAMLNVIGMLQKLPHGAPLLP